MDKQILSFSFLIKEDLISDHYMEVTLHSGTRLKRLPNWI